MPECVLRICYDLCQNLNEKMPSVEEIMLSCRLCSVGDHVNVPIFEEEGDIKKIFLKIKACLPVKVSREDKLPKKICYICLDKLDSLYKFWNMTVNTEKQFLTWLNQEKQTIKEEVIVFPESPDKSTSGTALESTQNCTPGLEHQVLNKSCINFESVTLGQIQESNFVYRNEENGDTNEPLPKRRRQQPAIKADQHIMQNNKDDFDSVVENLTKREEKSDDSGGELGPHSNSVSVSVEYNQLQAGSSGPFTDVSIEAPCHVTSQDDRTDMNQLSESEIQNGVNYKTKYNLKDCAVVIGDLESVDPKKYKFVNSNLDDLKLILMCKFKCKMCDLEFTGTSPYIEHQTNHIIGFKRRRRESGESSEVNDGDKLETNGDTAVSTKTQCKFCKNTFNDQVSFKVHMSMVHPFRCLRCSRVFLTIHQSLLHTKMHIVNDKKNKRTSQFRQISVAQKKKQQESKLKDAIKAPESSKQGKYGCTECDSRFEDCYQLQRHSVTFHNMKPQKRYDKIKLFKCVLCYNNYTNESLLEEHKRTHMVEVRSVNEDAMMKLDKLKTPEISTIEVNSISENNPKKLDAPKAPILKEILISSGQEIVDQLKSDIKEETDNATDEDKNTKTNTGTEDSITMDAFALDDMDVSIICNDIVFENENTTSVINFNSSSTSSNDQNNSYIKCMPAISKESTTMLTVPNSSCKPLRQYINKKKPSFCLLQMISSTSNNADVSGPLVFDAWPPSEQNSDTKDKPGDVNKETDIGNLHLRGGFVVSAEECMSNPVKAYKVISTKIISIGKPKHTVEVNDSVTEINSDETSNEQLPEPNDLGNHNPCIEIDLTESEITEPNYVTSEKSTDVIEIDSSSDEFEGVGQILDEKCIHKNIVPRVKYKSVLPYMSECVICRKKYVYKFITLMNAVRTCVWCNFTISVIANRIELFSKTQSPLATGMLEFTPNTDDSTSLTQCNICKIGRHHLQFTMLDKSVVICNYCRSIVSKVTFIIANQCMLEVFDKKKTFGSNRDKLATFRCVICTVMKSINEIIICNSVALCNFCEANIFKSIKLISIIEINSTTALKESDDVLVQTKCDVCAGMKKVNDISLFCGKSACTVCKFRIIKFIQFFYELLIPTSKCWTCKELTTQKSVLTHDTIVYCNECLKFQVVNKKQTCSVCKQPFELVISGTNLTAIVCTSCQLTLKTKSADDKEEDTLVTLEEEEKEKHSKVATSVNINTEVKQNAMEKDNTSLPHAASSDEEDRLVIDLDTSTDVCKNDRNKHSNRVKKQKNKTKHKGKQSDNPSNVSKSQQKSKQVENEIENMASTSAFDGLPKIFVKPLQNLLEPKLQTTSNNTIKCAVCNENVVQENVTLYAGILACRTCKLKMECLDYKSDNFTCFYCSEVFESKAILTQHKNSIHLCHICSKYRENVAEHLKKIVKCQLCPSIFCKKIPLNEHYRCKHESRWCSICDIVLRDDYEVLVHRQSVHNQK